LEQPFGPGKIGLLQLALRFSLLQVGTCLIERGLIRARVDHEQEVARLDQLAVLEADLVDVAADARRICTLSTASVRPVYSSHSTISFRICVATVTGGGGAGGCACVVVCNLPKSANSESHPAGRPQQLRCRRFGQLQ
jgi:hypothetical protein